MSCQKSCTNDKKSQTPGSASFYAIDTITSSFQVSSKTSTTVCGGKGFKQELQVKENQSLEVRVIGPGAKTDSAQFLIQYKSEFCQKNLRLMFFFLFLQKMVRTAGTGQRKFPRQLSLLPQIGSKAKISERSSKAFLRQTRLLLQNSCLPKSCKLFVFQAFQVPIDSIEWLWQTSIYCNVSAFEGSLLYAFMWLCIGRNHFSVPTNYIPFWFNWLVPLHATFFRILESDAKCHGMKFEFNMSRDMLKSPAKQKEDFGFISCQVHRETDQRSHRIVTFDFDQNFAKCCCQLFPLQVLGTKRSIFSVEARGSGPTETKTTNYLVLVSLLMCQRTSSLDMHWAQF